MSESELLGNIKALADLDFGVHWFCGRTDGHPNGPSDADSEALASHKIKDMVFSSMMIFSFDGKDAKGHQDTIESGITRNLIRCEYCISDYYKGKKRMLEGLREQGFSDDDVDMFSDMLDDRDIKRISRGLARATETLRGTPEAERRPGVLNRSNLMSIYEALYCEKLLKDEEMLVASFDEPFRLCQTMSRLSPANLSPAMARFPFSENEFRRSWAITQWRIRPELDSQTDFDFALRPALVDVLRKVAPLPVTEAMIPLTTRFWSAMKEILAKLSSYIITHGLRTLDTDVCRLFIDHLNIDKSTFLPLMQSLTVLLERAPTDFWDAMGTISPKSIIEGIFHNSVYDRTMSVGSSEEVDSESEVNALVSWVKPFMVSVPSSNQPPACRQLAHQFLQRLQAERFPERARTRCYEAGLNVLKWVMLLRMQHGTTSDAVSRAVATNLLVIVAEYLDEILSRIEGQPVSGPNSERIKALCEDVIRAALTLECRLLRIDHKTLAKDKHLTEGSKHVSLGIWKKIAPRINIKDTVLARVALPATTELSDLGQFGPKGHQAFAEERQRFNRQFKECIELISRVFEVVGDMHPHRLTDFVKNDDVRPALLAALLSSEDTLYNAAMDVAKNMSGESVRIDALRYLLECGLAPSISDFSELLNRISISVNFYSCPRMLRTSNDILTVLCDSQDGLLMNKDFDNAAKMALSKFWKYQWAALTTIYKSTETWSTEQDRGLMKEFCRDAMQFSDDLFDQYVVFQSATQDRQDDKEVDEQLLVYPTSTMNSLVVWLRLRDEFLAATAVRITKKLIEQLYRNDMRLSDTAIGVLGGVVQDKVRTNLSLQQKAELARALEGDDGQGPSFGLSSGVTTKDSQGPSPRDSPVLAARSRPQKLKTGKIDFATWNAKARAGEIGDEDVIDLTKENDTQAPAPRKENASVTAAAEKFKKQQEFKAQIARRQIEERRRQTEAATLSFIEKRNRERLEKKQKDAAIAAKLKAQNPNSLAGQTAGAGSALSGLGNLAKDHSKKKGTGMLLSSDEDSDADSDDGALFGKSKAPKFSSSFKNLEAARQTAQVRGPVKKIKQIRSADAMRARLTPNLEALHKVILGWDLFTRGDFPPGSSRNDYALVTDSFRTPNDYKRTFEPLLLLEAWQGFRQTLEEDLGKQCQLQVASRLSVNSLVEVSASMDEKEFQGIGLSDADILILSSEKDYESTKARCLARICKPPRKRKGGVEIALRVSPDNNGLLNKLTASSDVFVTKLGSLTPLEREYASLAALEYYDLCDEIIKAIPSPLLKYSEEKLGKISRLYSLNTAQARAVQSAVDNDAFTLIQGPPGSGKTKTIVSIVGALLTETLRKFKGVAIPQVTNGNTPSASGVALKKLLVCAPSNAAVDELVMRLMEGVKTYSGESHKINVVRLGRSDKINPKVAAVTLEELTRQQMGMNEKSEQGPTEIGKAMEDHKKVSSELNALRAHLDEADAGSCTKDPNAGARLEELKRRKNQLSSHIDRLKDSGNTKARDQELQRNKVQQAILDSAHVLCATLSGSGHDALARLKIDFETVVIDEAAQSVELSALIPLKYGCQKCIMVGDPKQLPPTVLSREAARFQYEQSLFVRMQNNKPEDVHLLDTQYRMHPEISKFPSHAFYDDRLLDGPSMDKLRTKFWHQDPYLGPYRFFDVQGQHQSGPRGHSLINTAEVEVAVQLYSRLRKVSTGYDFVGKIGIITPYKSQLQRLRDTFRTKFEEGIFDTIEFNTTDAFQGRESEVIIFSCVRASEGSIGFLSDIRRMNVGITRAKCSLWVLGNIKSLNRGEYWKKMIHDARERKLVTEGDVRKLIQQPAKTLRNTESQIKAPHNSPPPESIVSPIDDPRTRGKKDSDEMDIDHDTKPPNLEESKPLSSNGYADKRKRASLGFDDSLRAKSPRVEAAISDTVELKPKRESPRLDESLSDQKEDDKTKPRVAAPQQRPKKQAVPVKRQAPSVFMTKPKRR